MFLRRYTGYVEQFDTLLPTLTPYEMLLYTAELKRDRKEPIDHKKQIVEDVIQALALETCRNTPIGSALTRGISGGQAKRVNIGIALVSNPRVLFLDEPTSGLDSFTSTCFRIFSGFSVDCQLPPSINRQRDHDVCQATCAPWHHHLLHHPFPHCLYVWHV